MKSIGTIILLFIFLGTGYSKLTSISPEYMSGVENHWAGDAHVSSTIGVMGDVYKEAGIYNWKVPEFLTCPADYSSFAGEFHLINSIILFGMIGIGFAVVFGLLKNFTGLRAFFFNRYVVISLIIFSFVFQVHSSVVLFVIEFIVAFVLIITSRKKPAMN